MAVATYTKSGNKATTPAKLDKAVFGVEVKNHQLLKEAYLAYMANGRTNDAVAKRRGEVRGGGRKPWRQKGTGNARFGSSRNPIWRGGGVAFGPTGLENYSRKLSLSAKRQALRQALSLAAKENRLKVVESIDFKEGKVKPTAALLKNLETADSVVLVVSQKDDMDVRATRNLTDTKLIQAKYLNVYDIMNADHIVITNDALAIVHEWLGGSK
jgi:large subunit ribosomal protein L4